MIFSSLSGLGRGFGLNIHRCAKDEFLASILVKTLVKTTF
jgi:hypothetical protein